MKQIIKILCLMLAVALIMCNITVLATEKEPTVVIGNSIVSVGGTSRIAVTVENFDSFVGGYNFEIKFPEVTQVTDVYLGETKLTSLEDGGSDYNVRVDNTLVLAGTCNYGIETDFSNNSVYYVDFNTSAEIATGEYSVEFSEDTYIVSDSNDEELIFPATVNGKINVRGLKADINESGSADATDIVILRKWLIGIDGGNTFNETVADINNDGELDIRDLVAIKKYFARAVVYLSDNGDDSNEGNMADKPVATLDRAIEQVYEGGTVYITDTYTLDSKFTWAKHFKPIVISGGTLDATAVSALKMADDTTFSDITLNCKSGADIYANGYELKIGEDVIVSGKPYLYGGSTVTVKSTSMEIYSGSYQYIFGGGKNADVTGDTNVVIGGNVNNDLNQADHSGGVYIVGGSNNGVVEGDTYLTVGGNAKSTYIIGAGIGAESNVLGKTNVEITGGAFMGAYAGSTNGKCSDTELILTGGTIEQIFGGSENASITGNTSLKILGGTVTRRIYGGCYNTLSDSGEWLRQYHVSGNTTVLLSSKANINFGTFNDYGIFACSRYESHFDDENSTIIYEDATTKSKFNGILGQQDWLMKFISSWPNAAKTVTTLN